MMASTQSDVPYCKVVVVISHLHLFIFHLFCPLLHFVFAVWDHMEQEKLPLPMLVQKNKKKRVDKDHKKMAPHL